MNKPDPISWLLQPYNLKLDNNPILKDNLLFSEEQDNWRGGIIGLNKEELDKRIKEKEEEAELLIIKPNSPTSQFRPTQFNQYIGQLKAKEIFQKYIEVSNKNKNPLPHTLIHGSAGCGKTTLARLISMAKHCNFIEVIASSVKKPNDLITVINKVNGGVLFIDEIHGLPRNTAEWLYTVMEDFIFNGKKIKPFTLIGATTEYGEILKNRKPFCDRFKIIIELENYNIEDMEKLIKQYREHVFPKKNIINIAIKAIATNCRLTPRFAIRLLEATLYFNGDYKTVFNNFNIIKDGFTTKDIKVLNYLKQNQGSGIDSICAYLNVSRNSYNYEIEPYLLQTGVIMRTSSGRKITQEGIKLLSSI
jgi:holliday junction DNA helicase RuvB